MICLKSADSRSGKIQCLMFTLRGRNFVNSVSLALDQEYNGHFVRAKRHFTSLHVIRRLSRRVGLFRHVTHTTSLNSICRRLEGVLIRLGSDFKVL